MTPLMVRSMLLVFGASVVGSFGAVFLKMGALRLNGSVWSFVNSRLVLGVSLYLASSVIYAMGVRGGQLSVLYPLVSLGYIFTLVWSKLFFNEPITRYKVAGLSLILAGKHVTRSSQRQQVAKPDRSIGRGRQIGVGHHCKELSRIGARSADTNTMGHCVRRHRLPCLVIELGGEGGGNPHDLAGRDLHGRRRGFGFFQQDWAVDVRKTDLLRPFSIACHCRQVVYQQLKEVRSGIVIATSLNVGRRHINFLAAAGLPVLHGFGQSCCGHVGTDGSSRQVHQIFRADDLAARIFRKEIA